MITSVGVVITSYLRSGMWEGVEDSQFDDMRMSQHFQVLDLSLDSGVHVWRGDLCSIDQLERDLMTGDAVRSNCHEFMARV